MGNLAPVGFLTTKSRRTVFAKLPICFRKYEPLMSGFIDLPTKVYYNTYSRKQEGYYMTKWTCMLGACCPQCRKTNFICTTICCALFFLLHHQGLIKTSKVWTRGIYKNTAVSGRKPTKHPPLNDAQSNTSPMDTVTGKDTGINTFCILISKLNHALFV